MYTVIKYSIRASLCVPLYSVASLSMIADPHPGNILVVPPDDKNPSQVETSRRGYNQNV